MAADSKHSKPRLSHFGFWDVDQSILDYDKYASFVIIRVMERGNDQDMEEIIRYYGKEAAIRELTSARSLMPTAIEAGKQLFQLEESYFICLSQTKHKIEDLEKSKNF
jgi:hypothetical protein